MRLELQSQKGDTQILYDGHTVTVYDAATNTLYRYTPPPREGAAGSQTTASATEHEVPSVAKIEEAIAHLSKHADVSGATPTDVAGQPAYTVRVSPNEGGSLFGGVELSFDANNGVPLRAAIYSSTSSSPVIELAATEISYGPVESSVFEMNPPANAKVEEISGQRRRRARGRSPRPRQHGKPKLTHPRARPGDDRSCSKARPRAAAAKERWKGCRKVTIDGTTASELRTELGTLLSFERGGVRYLLAGSVSPSAIETVARGL